MNCIADGVWDLDAHVFADGVGLGRGGVVIEDEADGGSVFGKFIKE